MSGMSGLVSFYGKCNEIYGDKVESLLSVLEHRGADKSFFIDDTVLFMLNYFNSNENSYIPVFCSVDNRKIAVLSGRIYNHKAIEELLKNKGYSFNYGTQEEVAINAFCEWGINCAKMFDGMFSFAVYDLDTKKLYLFRDRIGQNDLFYYVDDRGAFFGSELKALRPHFRVKPEIDTGAISCMLMNQFIYEPRTIYKKIYKVEKATCVIISEDGKIEKHKYWEIDKLYYEHDFETDFNRAKKNIRNLVFSSVEQCMANSNELGAFLSGGIDSSILAGVLSKLSNKKVHTFSIGFKSNKYDESDKFLLQAKLFNTEHHYKYIDYSDIEPYWEKVLFNFDEPYGDSSCYPEFLCGKMASDYVSYALGGEGMDEMFAGYPIQSELKNSEYLRYAPFYSKKVKGIHLINEIFLPELFESYKNSDVREFMLTNDLSYEMQGINSKIFYGGNSLFTNSMQFFLSTHHTVELMKVDRACSLAGIETLRPFLSNNIVEYSMKILENFKIYRNERKYIVKEAFRDLLPDKIYYQPKKGFSAPVIEWLREYRLNELEHLFSREFVEMQKIFKYDAIEKVFNSFKNGSNMWSFWLLYVIQKWYSDVYLR